MVTFTQLEKWKKKFMKKILSMKLWKNVFINIVSSGLVTAIIQLLIFPLLSRQMSSESFGIAVSLYGFNNLIVVFLGNSMNNIRLIYDNKIEEKGNFSFLVILSLVGSFIFSSVLYLLYGGNQSAIEIVITVLFTVISTFRAYLLVYFRLQLEYVKVLYTNILILIGYIIGLLLFTIIPIWSIVFLVGETIGTIYCLKNSTFKLEKVKKTNSLKFLSREYGNLTLSNGVSNGLKYLDRFLITPLLGAASMSLYYSVSVFSKIINMVVIPFNNVLLSYINNMNSREARKYFLIINVCSAGLMIPVFFILNFVTPYFLRILYPQFVEDAIPYISVVNLANIFNLLTSISNPFILKFHEMKSQVYIQIFYGSIYVLSALYLSYSYGLMGFAIATAFSFFLKWVLMLILGLRK